LSAYLDTQIVIWISAGRMKKLTREALRTIESSDLLISPIVLVEIGYLFEINRLVKSPLAILDQLQKQIGLKVSDHPFPAIANAALFETWTRDLFDRLIVAHARSDGYSGLVTSDEKIRKNYSKAIW
jgi:PIN domain nuclease of toxin-antitoxin system